jgi:hypothetical protein
MTAGQSGSQFNWVGDAVKRKTASQSVELSTFRDIRAKARAAVKDLKFAVREDLALTHAFSWVLNCFGGLRRFGAVNEYATDGH